MKKHDNMIGSYRGGIEQCGPLQPADVEKKGVNDPSV